MVLLLFFERVEEVIQVLLREELNAKVIDAENDFSFARVVFPQPRSPWYRIVPVFPQVLYKLLVRQDSRLL